MSFDKYSDKAAEAIALIREFAKVEYWDFFKGDPEQSLEAFCAMQDAAEEMGRMKAQDSTEKPSAYKVEFPDGAMCMVEHLPIAYSQPDANCKITKFYSHPVPQDNVPGVSELPVVKTWQERCEEEHGFIPGHEWKVPFMLTEIADLRAALSTYRRRATMEVPNERQAFEAWHEKRWGKPFRLGQTDQYKLDSSQGKWQAWLGRAELAAPSQPQQEAVPAELNEPMSQADIERELFGDGEAGAGED